MTCFVLINGFYWMATSFMRVLRVLRNCHRKNLKANCSSQGSRRNSEYYCIRLVSKSKTSAVVTEVAAYRHLWKLKDRKAMESIQSVRGLHRAGSNGLNPSQEAWRWRWNGWILAPQATEAGRWTFLFSWSFGGLVSIHIGKTIKFTLITRFVFKSHQNHVQIHQKYFVYHRHLSSHQTIK